jgi:hypothetical protein
MKKIIRLVKNKIPDWENIIPVYAVISFVIYGWTLYWFLHDLPAWLNYLHPIEIINQYTYILMVNLLESLFILLIVLVLCIILPRNWLFTEFVYQGTVISLFIVTYLIALIVRRSQIMVFSINMVRWFPVILLIAFILIVLAGKLNFIKRATEEIADRITIFLYLNIPFSILATIAITVRALK